MHFWILLLTLLGTAFAAPTLESSTTLQARGELSAGQLETVQHTAHYLPKFFEEVLSCNVKDELFMRYFGGNPHKPATKRSKRVKKIVQDILDQGFHGDTKRTSGVENGFTVVYGGNGPGD